MTYQVKLIKEGLWCTFTEHFQCFYIYIKAWWSAEN